MLYYVDMPKIHTIILGGGTFMGDYTKNTSAIEPYNYSNTLIMKSKN